MAIERSTPSAEGVRAVGVAAFVEALERLPNTEPHGLIIQRHGRRIVDAWWAPHAATDVRLVYSLSKTFTGTALGLAVGDGLIGLDDPVADHLPDLLAGTGDRTRRMRIRHIASMATGHDREMLAEAAAADPDDPVRGFFSIPPDAEPGTLFMYNQPPVLALARILQQVRGERLLDTLRRRVLDPIGAGEVRWRQQGGCDLGYSGVFTTLDTIARLGQLYLDDGEWDGARLLPEGWVAEASAVQTPNPEREEPDWRQGYGFQLWRARHGYRGDGAFGQYMVVLPEQDAVVALFSGTELMQPVLDALWEHLLPAFDDLPLDAPLAREGDDALAARLATLTKPTAMQRTGGEAAGAIAGTFTRAPGVPSHTTVTAVDVADGGVVVHEGDASFAFPLSDEWTVIDGWLATSAATVDGRTVVDVVFLHTPHRIELELDPATATFVARWPMVPLFGGGIGTRLATFRPPD